jgi:hypothetical protein
MALILPVCNYGSSGIGLLSSDWRSVSISLCASHVPSGSLELPEGSVRHGTRVPLVLFSPQILHSLFAKEFAPGILPLRILRGWLILLGPSWGCAQFILSFRMEKRIWQGRLWEELFPWR